MRTALLGVWLAAAPLAAQPLAFEETAARAGVDFVLRNHPTERKHMVETMPGGLAAFDYDGDGLVDLFFANGAPMPAMRKSLPADADRLYRNLGGGRFEDATERAGVAGAGYSMGAAAGDFDNDGFPDLFVAGAFSNRLLRNNGDGTFADVTARSGIASDGWSVAAGWFDYDNDGLLDLFVVNYADWTPAFDRYCGDRARGLRVYCHPKYFEPVANRLYRNLGGGRFRDVSAETGVGAHAGRGMSVVFADFDGDGRPDAFVTNDNLPNFLFVQPEPGRFAEHALLAGAALLDHGKAVASMGADVGDYDNDGALDIVVTALSGETFPLFRGEGAGEFSDATHRAGLAKLVARYAGWGVGWADFDNDGWLDLFAANGHVNDLVEQFEPYAYRQPNIVARNRAGKFAEAVELPGARVHRGSAIADFDGDGRLDIAVSALGEPAELWLNRSEAGNWIAFRLRGRQSNRDGIGACVEAAGRTRCMTSSAGYASSSLRPVHFGLGQAAGPLDAVVRWPSGAVQRLGGLRPNAVVEVREPAER